MVGHHTLDVGILGSTPSPAAMIYKRLPLEEFMAIYHKVPRAAVDVVIKSDEGILLTKRSIPPFKGLWHTPGGTILFNEPISSAIDRITKEELGVKVNVIRHLGVIEYYEDDGRHTISNVYLAEINEGTPKGSKQAKEVAFFKKLPKNCNPFQKKLLSHYQKTTSGR